MPQTVQSQDVSMLQRSMAEAAALMQASGGGINVPLHPLPAEEGEVDSWRTERLQGGSDTWTESPVPLHRGNENSHDVQAGLSLITNSPAPSAQETPQSRVCNI